MCGVGAIEELENSKVSPSGAAVATARAAMVPWAPSRFSMTNDCLRSVASCCAMVRACRSGPEPAAQPTRMRTGPAGYCCADAGRAAAAKQRARRVRSIGRSFPRAFDPLAPLLRPVPVRCHGGRRRTDVFPRIVRGFLVRDFGPERGVVFHLDLGVAAGVLRRPRTHIARRERSPRVVVGALGAA